MQLKILIKTNFNIVYIVSNFFICYLPSIKFLVKARLTKISGFIGKNGKREQFKSYEIEGINRPY